MFELRFPLAVLLGVFLGNFALPGPRLKLKLLCSLLWTSLICLFTLAGLGMDPDFALLLFLSGTFLSIAQFFVGAMANRSVSLGILRCLLRGDPLELVKADYERQIRSRLEEAKSLGLLREDESQQVSLSTIGQLPSLLLSLWIFLFDSLLPRLVQSFVNAFPRLVVWAVYLGSVGFRYYFTFFLALPDKHIVSDSLGYYVRAKNVCEQSYPWGINDIIFPPGTDYLFGAVYCLRGNLLDISWTLVVFSSLIPLLIFSIASQLCERRVAYLSLLLSSVYFPFINYGGYYLSEIPMMVCFFAATSAMIRLLKSQQSLPRVLPLCLLTGLLYGAAGSIKMQSFAPLLLTAVLYPLFLRKQRLRIFLMFLVIGLGTLPVLIPCSIRCTKLNEGRFCLIGKTFGMNFLVGHQLKNPYLRFTDSRRGLHYLLMGPGMDYNPNAPIPEVNFGPYDDEEVRSEAIRMIREHPKEMAMTFVRTALAYLGGVKLWPFAEVPVEVYQIFRVFFWCMLGTLLLHFLLNKCGKGSRSLPPEYWQLHLAIFAGFICGTLASGEPRYRIPFDAFVIILFARAIFGIPERVKAFFSRPRAT